MTPSPLTAGAERPLDVRRVLPCLKLPIHEHFVEHECCIYNMDRLFLLIDDLR